MTCATHEDPSHINNSNQTAFPKNFDALIQPRSSTANPAITTSFVVSAASATTVAAEVADTTTHSQMQLLAHGQSGGYQILKYSIPYRSNRFKAPYLTASSSPSFILKLGRLHNGVLSPCLPYSPFLYSVSLSLPIDSLASYLF